MTVVEVAYALAWDLEVRAPWRPLTDGAARERDAAGLPYVAVYRIPGRETPLEVRLVSWRDHYVGLWLYDEQGRRSDALDFRLLDDQSRLLSRSTRRWQYPTADMAEFDARCPRSSTELFPNGKGSVSLEPEGTHGRRLVDAPRADARRWQPRPGFEEWPVVAALWQRLPGQVALRPAVPEPGAATPDALDDLSDAPATCWRPPRPAQPGPIGELFRPGVRVTDGYHPEQTVVEPRRVATLRVPSGLLAVSGPDNSDEDPAITVPVPPGEYAVEEARVGFSYQCAWREEEVTTTQATAIRLLVGESPAATWEMALGADDDPRLFLDGQITGFDTDGATGCFADAGAWKPLAELYERGLIQGEPDLDGYEDVDDGSLVMQRTRDAASGGELLAFATTGDGTYPVWLGRSEAGEVVAVVVLIEGMPDLLPEQDAVAVVNLPTA